MSNIISFQTCFSGLSVSLATTKSIDFKTQTIDAFVFTTSKIINNSYNYNVITGVSEQKNNQSSQIDALLAMLLQIARLDINDIDLMLCANGPGSFTGNRIGLSFCLGIKTAINKNLQLLPTTMANVSSFFNAGHTNFDKIISIVDGLNGEVYYQDFNCRTQSEEILLASDIFNVEIKNLEGFMLNKEIICSKKHSFFTSLFQKGQNKNSNVVVFCTNHDIALKLKKFGVTIVLTQLPTSLDVISCFLLSNNSVSIFKQDDNNICYVRPAIK